MKLELEQIQLYPEMAPGSEHVNLEEECFEERMPEGGMKQVVQNISVPTITPFLVQESTRSGRTLQNRRAAVLVIPGGAYRRLVFNFEGVEVAKWLSEQGINAFVLKCRLPVNNHENRVDVALMDATRAMRVIRSHADQWGIDMEKVGVMGFSAGGSIASALATCFDQPLYEAVDDVDKISARPDFCVLGYPAISAEVEIRSRLRKVMGASIDNVPIVRQLTVQGEVQYTIGDREMTDEMLEQFHVPMYLLETISKYSTDLLVTKNTPPAFIFETDEDVTTLSQHSVQFYLACKRAGVPAELHIFQKGAHGFGLGNDGDLEETGQWKNLFLKWAKIQGINDIMCRDSQR